MQAGTFNTDRGSHQWLERLDPRFKLAIVAWVSTLGVLCDSTPSLVVLTLVALLFASGLRWTGRGGLFVLGMLVAIAWGTVLSQGLFYAASPRTALVTFIKPREWHGWSFPGLELYQEGMTYGLKQSLRMISVTLAGLTVCLSTGPERLFAALAKLRVPAAIGFMTVTALRMLPLLAAEYTVTRQARRLRGGRGRFEVALLLPVLASALRRASALAISVSARGFDPSSKRTYYPPLRTSTRERWLLLMLAAVWLVVVTATFLNWLSLAGLYHRPEWQSLYRFVRHWL